MPQNKIQIDPTWSAESKPEKSESPWGEPEPVKPTGKQNPKDWMGRPILEAGHHDDLEMRSAIGQFAMKLPKEQAEAQAYKEYTQEHSKKAAAHHLGGIQAALAAGDKGSAQKHGIMYNQHMRLIGLDPLSSPPDDIIQMSSPNKNYKFSDHPADAFVGKKGLPLQKADKSANQIGASAPMKLAGISMPAAPIVSPSPNSSVGWLADTGMFKPVKQTKVMAAPRQAKVQVNKLAQELAPEFSPPHAVGDKDIGTGKQHVNTLKVQAGLPKADLSWRSRSPLGKRNPAKTNIKDKNQVIDAALKQGLLSKI